MFSGLKNLIKFLFYKNFFEKKMSEISVGLLGKNFIKFPPGSKEAREKGCKCPSLSYQGTLLDSRDGTYLYFVNPDCELHQWQEQQLPMFHQTQTFTPAVDH